MQYDVVIPGFGLTSFAVARCLAGLGCRITAIGTRKPGFKAPLLHSNLPTRKVVIDPDVSIVDALADLRGSFEADPFLILTEDSHVMQVSAERERVVPSYRILLPQHDLVASLMDKDRFAALAQERGFSIPQSIKVAGPEAIASLPDQLSFPFILKPYLLHSQIVHDEDQLRAYVDSFEPVQWTSVIAQGWIPGGAETLFWCLAYLDENSRCIAQVTGNKTRLWPPQSGNASLCRTQPCPRVTDETIRILETLGLVGFASIEYKYDARDDTYYILEPTIGRCDQQIAIGRAAGVNLPDIALRNLANGESPTFHQRDGTTMMWEIWDIIARWHPQQDCRESYLKHLTNADLRMLSSISDTGPLFASLGSLLGESLRALRKKLIR